MTIIVSLINKYHILQLVLKWILPQTKEEKFEHR